MGDSESALKEALNVLGLTPEKVRVLLIEDEIINETRLLNFIREHSELARAGMPLKVYAGKEGKLNSFFNRLAYRLPAAWREASVQIQTLEILHDLVENLLSVIRMNQSLKIAA